MIFTFFKNRFYSKSRGITVNSFNYILITGGSEYRDFVLDPLTGTVSLARRLEDNELVQPVTLVVKVCALKMRILKHLLT